MRLLALVYFTIGAVIFDTLPVIPGVLEAGFGSVPPYLELRLWTNLGFALLALLPLVAVRNVIWAAPLAGGLIAVPGYAMYLSSDQSIVLIVWHGVFGSFLFVVLLFNAMAESVVSPLSQEIDVEKGAEERVLQIRDELWALLKITAQGAVAFTAITGVTMSILFRQGFEEHGLTVTATQMVSGFFWCGVGMYIWIAAPTLSGLSTVHEWLFRRRRQHLQHQVFEGDIEELSLDS